MSTSPIGGVRVCAKSVRGEASPALSVAASRVNKGLALNVPAVPKSPSCCTFPMDPSSSKSKRRKSVKGPVESVTPSKAGSAPAAASVSKLSFLNWTEEQYQAKLATYPDLVVVPGDVFDLAELVRAFIDFRKTGYVVDSVFYMYLLCFK